MSKSIFAMEDDDEDLVDPPKPPDTKDDPLFDDDDDLLEGVAVEEISVPNPTSTPPVPLTMSQKARMERNRLKAKSLKQARLMARPYANNPGSSRDQVTGEKLIRVQEKKLVDSGAGFFIEETSEGSDAIDPSTFVQLPAPIIKPDQPSCLECQENFSDSFLFRTFDISVCDKCKETERDGKHELITKTDAKNTFLLKDVDIDKREPVLKFIIRKNPHNPRWGDMKLFLRSQIEDRALEVWGSEEALERQHDLRDEKKEKTKAKRFNNQIKALRMQVRGSLYKKDLSTHKHEFGEEHYDEKQDDYYQKCQSCEFVKRYEKM
ncbi:hypothetical protein TCAL_03958 [Tigriopus californicus]|uniref:XPA C-terminal domain-containing protein n=1 Tax=Tigriopus californicus TaxID=6832 RepID=A0A553P2Y3_TIGCA|nr:DNA repair protein complementing XP-A cells homolog [Tigriopus californicus]TRY71992.1 hypothetical protein TCAL_03958 [Tigriopus californicus]|eukprot:TCALIF_03958-PA protein Name:"Similar to Xpac DNA repair protein complementing XP-A cells homolog (Drosophila melanogaster)" AED:0.06 eAED:0.06 QI:0/-1/0/1/-1/1/1/0/320